MHGPVTVTALGVAGVLAFLLGLFIGALFLALAGKLVGIEKATVGRSMIAILGGGIIAGIVAVIVASFFPPLASILAFIANVWVIKTVFDTDWLRALLAWILSAVIAAVIIIILAALGLFTLGALAFL